MKDKAFRKGLLIWSSLIGGCLAVWGVGIFVAHAIFW